jgi:sialate O-acetylesterase
MVVQRDQPVHIWGRAHYGEKVVVRFRGETRETAADGVGRWSVHFSPRAAGGPFDVRIEASNAIVLRDVLVGDVWLAAGQSNMEWPVRWAANPDAEIARSRHPGVRLFRAMHRVSDYPYEDTWGKTWADCGPESAADFSAVGYHFGRMLQDHVKVPVGVIQTAWGGTPIDAWTNLRAITADPALLPSLAEWARMMEKHSMDQLRYQRALREWKARRDGSEEPGKPHGPFWKPGGIYNAMVAPLTQYPIRGVIWYQGESNTPPERAPIYGRLFQTMIQDWRRAWGSDFPFLFVQLANYNATPDSMWPELREAQRQALSLEKTAMAVAIDIGEPDDIHPKNKQEVARRLWLAARAVAYGEQLEHMGPLLRQAARQGASVRLWFDHASGLNAQHGILKGFEVAGATGEFVPAKARIDGATVIVSSPGVPEPARVRYAWKDNPECNLYNSAGLPASPFRWP